MVSTLAAVGFGDILTGDPTFGVSAFRTPVGPIFYIRMALELRCARQLHRLRAFRAGRSKGNARNVREGFLRWHTPPTVQAGAQKGVSAAWRRATVDDGFNVR